MRPAPILPQTHEKIQERSTKKPLTKTLFVTTQAIFMVTLAAESHQYKS